MERQIPKFNQNGIEWVFVKKLPEGRIGKNRGIKVAKKGIKYIFSLKFRVLSFLITLIE